MKRFITVNALGALSDDIDKLFDYEAAYKGDECESITDKSQFVPESEALRKLKANGSGISEADMQYYDYPDGKGSLSDKVPVARLKGVDIAEISQAVQKQQKELKGEIEKQQKIAKLESHFAAPAAAQTSITSTSS